MITIPFFEASTKIPDVSLSPSKLPKLNHIIAKNYLQSYRAHPTLPLKLKSTPLTHRPEYRNSQSYLYNHNPPRLGSRVYPKPRQTVAENAALRLGRIIDRCDNFSKGISGGVSERGSLRGKRASGVTLNSQQDLVKRSEKLEYDQVLVRDFMSAAYLKKND